MNEQQGRKKGQILRCVGRKRKRELA